SRSNHLFNFHSWMLLPLPGSIILQATSNNYLNTMALSAGYSYSDYEEANSLFTTFQYMRYWPILSINTSWGQRRTFKDKDHKVKEDAWEETRVQGLITLPYILNFDTYSQSLIFNGGFNLLETTGR